MTLKICYFRLPPLNYSTFSLLGLCLVSGSGRLWDRSSSISGYILPVMRIAAHRDYPLGCVIASCIWWWDCPGHDRGPLQQLAHWSVPVPPYRQPSMHFWLYEFLSPLHLCLVFQHCGYRRIVITPSQARHEKPRHPAAMRQARQQENLAFTPQNRKD